MGAKQYSTCSALLAGVIAACLVLGDIGVNSAQTAPVLFLTVKSCNFGMTKVDHLKCGYLIVTDILISPDGVPLPFFHDNSEFFFHLL